MKRWTKNMERWFLSGMLMLLLMLTACSSESGDGAQQPKEKPVLKIYLFAPESPIITRAENGWVSPSADEKRISTLDVWVFENNTSNLVSYIHLANLTFDGSKEVSMEISDAFANNVNKPHVDIYVIANVASSNCGLSLGRSSTPEQLTDALIERNFFGLTSPVTSVPVEGLPMSGFLLNQEISGTAPVFTANKTKNVKLVRAVSKVRFVFSKSTVAPVISDLSIELNTGVLPTKEYLFLKGEYPTEKIHLEETPAYEAEAEIVSGVSGDDINSCADPASYIFTTETGQQYENKIDAGLVEQTIENVTRPAELSEVRRFYLRESDKQMRGTISYTSGSGENATQKSADFEMNAAGDFTRNHTWIVYGYFLGSGVLILNAVALKDWEDNPESDNIYNW